jgi:hypothetical protein
MNTSQLRLIRNVLSFAECDSVGMAHDEDTCEQCGARRALDGLAIAIAAEREACAKVAEEHAARLRADDSDDANEYAAAVVDKVAALIRARK